jgi:putative ABC transport system ATP-binding protein
MTVVVITHNQAISPMADRIIRFNSGKVASVAENPSPVSVENIEW